MLKGKLNRYTNSTLTKMLIRNIIFKVLLLVIFVMVILFFYTREKMKEQTIVSINQNVYGIAREVEKMFDNIQLISDRYAYDQVINEYTQTYYGIRLAEKRRDVYELKSLLENSLRLDNKEKIAAIYTKYGEIFNFLNPMNDGEEVQQRLLTLGVVDKKNLSLLKWFVLDNNFLLTEGEAKVAEEKAVQEAQNKYPFETDFDNEAIRLRARKVLLGARRLINPFTGAFNYSHIFAITEKDLFETYETICKGISAHIFIINEDGKVISSTDPYKLNEQFSKEILQEIEQKDGSEFELYYDNKKQVICTTNLSNENWKVIAMIPAKTVTKSIDTLFITIIIIFLICMLACIFMIIRISKQFLQPVDLLNNAMKEVYNGNMEAYVQMKGYGEIQKMGEYYNCMLNQINCYIEEKIEIEQKKKQLELEVLMGQINPHFLYNTLENIVWKSSEVGRPDIGRMAASLGRMYRLSINNGEIIVKIQQEIEHVMTYINIQKMRYKERIEFDLSVPYDEIREFNTVKMILQPAVENCFMHGMENIEYQLKIRLKVRVFPDEIQFIIADNGCGMSKQELIQTREQILKGKKQQEGLQRKKGTGIGLHSIKERLALYFEQPNAVKINSKQNIGTIIKISIPKKKD